MNWFEDDEFWREFFPVMFPEERFAAASGQVEQILKLTGVQSGAVLDLCCGPGRHSQEFAQRGFAITGVDKSEFLLQQAKARSTAQVEWVRQDMRDFRRERAFDLACNLFTSFGYFESEDDNLQVLRNVHASLKPGGVFVLELLGKERLARIWKDSIVTDYPDGSTWVQRPQVRDEWCRVENEWLLIKGDSARRYSFKHWIYSARELKDLLRFSGFAKVDVFGDLGGSPYGLDALRLIAVARRVSP
jgi:SAM-dependent methyltransferase